MFYDLFVKACEGIGKAPTRVLIELGIGKSSITNWKNGIEPSIRTRKQVADYFNVSIDDFEKGIFEGNSNVSLSQENLMKIISLMTQNEKAAIQLDDSLKLIDMFDKLTKDQRSAVITLMQSMIADK